MKKLLLIGGGHSHIEVIRRFARQPMRDVQLTLVNPTPNAPYSGMLPGLIAGHYSFRQCHIDLPALTRSAGCRFVESAINGVHADAKLAFCKTGETLAYGVNVPGGVGHFRVLEIIRESQGAAIAVSESEIHATLSATWKDKGWWICPEGAACLAALPRLVDTGLIQPGDEVVAFNTGSLEKYLPDLRHLL